MMSSFLLERMQVVLFIRNAKFCDNFLPVVVPFSADIDDGGADNVKENRKIAVLMIILNETCKENIDQFIAVHDLFVFRFAFGSGAFRDICVMPAVAMLFIDKSAQDCVCFIGKFAKFMYFQVFIS